MNQRRVLVAAQCILAAYGLFASATLPAQDATTAAAPDASAAATVTAPTPAMITPSPTPSIAPSPSPQMLYPSASASSLVNPSPGQGSGGVGGLATTFLVLLAICAGGFILMRRTPGFSGGFKGVARKLVVSESRSLGNRQFLVVVEYEHERMLLGVTPGKIDYLCPLTGPHGEPGAFPPIKEVGA